MKKWLSLLFVACFIAGLAIILTADTGIMGNYFCSNLAGTLISLFSGICLTISVYSYFKSC